MVKILDGKKLADELISKLPKFQNSDKKLIIVTVGDDPASKVYVRNKIRCAEKIGLTGINVRYQIDVTFDEMLTDINKYNADDDVVGIIVQKPLPKHLDSIVDYVDETKDVDCGSFKSYSRVMAEDFSGFLPATPKGICTLLDSYGIDVEGKNVVIIGRSKLVGTPLAIMLKNRNATVTVCHSKTDPNSLRYNLLNANIIISAIGKPKWLNSYHITSKYKEDGPVFSNMPVIIDVGINRDENGKLCGDVDYEDVLPYVSAITPVPGGVGPMTVYSLIEQCVKKVYQK